MAGRDMTTGRSGSAPRNHGKNTTLVATLTPNGLQEPWLLVERAMNTDTFEWYIREQLAPRLQPGQIVFMDNLSAHKAARIREALVARGRDLLFLPPYSPDFNPLSRRFPNSGRFCAAWARAPRNCSKRRYEAVRLAVRAISSVDAAAWYAHAGYPLPAQPF